MLDQDNHTPTLIRTPAHAATPPQDPIKLATMCDMINSTGIYLYSTATIRDDDNDVNTDNKSEIAFECRRLAQQRV